ncbi:hypothetical protein [Pseudorhodoferax sp. Leaf267]|uniref:hypothetical protein n=1 Tax=Pseudorhodoferax sp. Leaf267 TaxID=1736316 RepID=UPI0006FDABBE|nr:hypothetical protein [Pseudorhodoferax sp. Leaf267]KQP22745.1 hypothetical protein ASF43_02255 [Pseudorhodoferax sp. Leaf267]
MTKLQFIISCVSDEFESYRKALHRQLDGPNVTGKIQEHFIAGGHGTLDKLDVYVRASDAVVHLVGDMTGALAPWAAVASMADLEDFARAVPAVAPFLAPGAPRLSYTQWEAWLALYRKRKLFIAVPLAGVPRSAGYRLDAAQVQAQQEHLARLEASGRHAEIQFVSDHDLVSQVQAVYLQELLDRPSDLAEHQALQARLQGFRGPVGWLRAQYLGAPDAPVPFGGRAREMEALNAWLEGRPEAGAPPLLAGRAMSSHLLVHAPAGRGKTALLIRWMAQLGRDWACIFVPVSIRAGTNEELTFYEALAAELAAHLGELLPPASGSPVLHYRSQVARCLARIGAGTRPCLVVVDGLDEARGWQIHPSVLAQADSPVLRIMVAARELAGDRGAGKWLGRLGWAPPHAQACTLRVGPLTRDGVADLLESMQLQIGPLSRDGDVVQELYRLSDGGDPLVLQFYAQDLQARGADAARLRPDQLRQLQPGFSAYIAQWMDDQSREWAAQGRPLDEGLLDAILAVLSCAHGPLQLADLEGIVQRTLPGRQPLFFKPATVEPLQRFILGDAQGAGYVLAHPKLATVLQQEVLAGGGLVRAARAAFAGWIRETVHSLNDGRLAPHEAPSYVLLFCVQHLAEGGATTPLDDWAALLDPGWRAAWERHEGDYRGYARDLESVAQALRAAADDNPAVLRHARHGLGGQVRCALLLSSIRSTGLDATGEVLAAFLQGGQIAPARALHLAQLKPEKERARAIGAFIHLLPQSLQQQALALADGIADPGARHDYRMAVAARLPPGLQAGAYQDALADASVLQGPARASALHALQPHVPAAQWDRVALAGHGPPAAPAAQAAAAPVPALDFHESIRLERYADQADLTPQDMRALLTHADWGSLGAHWLIALLAPRLNVDVQRFAMAQIARHESLWGDAMLETLALRGHQDLLVEVLQAGVAARRYHADRVAAALVQRRGGRLPPAFVTPLLALNWDDWGTSRNIQGVVPYLDAAALRVLLDEVVARPSLFANRMLQVLAARVPTRLLGRVLRASIAHAGLGLDHVLAAVAARYGGKLPAALQRSALKALRACDAGTSSAAHLAQWLAPLLDRGLLDALLQAMLATAGGGVDKPLRALVARGELDIADMLHAVLTMERRAYQDAALRGLGTLPPALLERALDTVLQRDDAEARSAFVALAPQLPPDRLVAALRGAAPERMAAILPACVALLPEAALGEAVAWAACIDGPRARAEVLAQLLPRLHAAGRKDSLAQALELTLNVGDEAARAVAQAVIRHGAALPPAAELLHVPTGGAARDGLVAAQTLVLMLRAQSVPEPRRTAVLEAAASATAGASELPARALLLGLVAPRLPQPRWSALIEDALLLAQSSSGADAAVLAQLLLLPFRPPDTFEAAAARLRADADGMADAGVRAGLLAALDCMQAFVRGAPADELLSATHACLDANSDMAGDALQAVACVLLLVFGGPMPATQRDQGLATIGALEDQGLQAGLRAAVAPCVPTPQLWPWMRQVLALAAQQTRPEALMMLALCQGLAHVALAHHAALGANRLGDSPLMRLGGQAAITETLAAIDEVCTAWP